MRKKLKIISFVFASVALGVAVMSGAEYLTAKKGAENLPQGFTVTAHTGCEGAEDNSLEAISRGVEAGADIVEFDLRFDSEGKGILSHDEDGNEAAVALEEALRLVSSYEGLRVNVDCKTTDNLKEVYRIGEELGITDRLFYTGIELEDVAAVRSQTPQIPYFLNYKVKKLKKNDEEYISSLVALVKENGALGLNIKYNQCSKRLVEIFHREGLQVSVWTANNTRVMLRCLSFKPDNITTRYPSELKKIINEIK